MQIIKILIVVMLSGVTASVTTEAETRSHEPSTNIDRSKIASTQPGKTSDKDILEGVNEGKRIRDDEQMTENAQQLANMLKITPLISELKEKSKSSRTKDDLVDLIVIRQKLSNAIQYASLELEEALANIDGDLAETNMQYAYFDAKHERASMLNSVATFVSSGTLGVLDSGTGIRHPAPLPNILGITGNALAVGIPMIGLLPNRYENPKQGQRSGNMLAPIFGLSYSGSGYDPIIWEYLQATPADQSKKVPRRQVLLNNWETYKGIHSRNGSSKSYIERLCAVSSNDQKTSLAILKTRAELLVELRAQVQHLYKHISDLNTSIMAL